MKNVLAALALLSAAIVSPLVGQGDDEFTRKSLAGLKGVAVIIEQIAEEVQRDGLSQDQIQTDVELKLRQVGITVLTEQQSSALTGIFLYVNVNAFKNATGLYAYNLEVAVSQQVKLLSNPAVIVPAHTWSRSRLGTVGSAHLSAVRDDIRDLTDSFINAYLAANPKR